jgi:hypothetical protein
MKSVDIERRRARKWLVGASCGSLIIGFIACSGSSEHRAAPHIGAGGEGVVGGQAGEPVTQQGGSESARAGESSGGVSGGSVGGEQSAGGVLSLGGEVGAGGVAGEIGLGGAGGQSLGGEAGGGNGGAGGDGIFVDPVCGVNMVKVGEYSLWCGKVNEHTDADGMWQWDADCSSGCNVTGITYCQKFYPSATAVVTVPQLVTRLEKRGLR